MANTRDREIYAPESVIDGNQIPIGIVRNNQDLKKRHKGYEKFSFNLLVSDRIGYQRTLPDTRHHLYVFCRPFILCKKGNWE